MTPHPGGDTRVKAIKSDSDSDSDEQKRSPGFSGKNRGVTPSVAASGVTHLVTPLYLHSWQVDMLHPVDADRDGGRPRTFPAAL